MNKTTEALIRGYVLFQVNNKLFLSYNAALAARKAVPDTHSVSFTGLHILKGWQTFFMRIVTLHQSAKGVEL
jgi:hypothetical protein